MYYDQPTIVSTITEGDYIIRSVATGKCIDISSSTADGAKVQEWDCKWYQRAESSILSRLAGYFKIINVNSAVGTRHQRCEQGAERPCCSSGPMAVATSFGLSPAAAVTDSTSIRC